MGEIVQILETYNPGRYWWKSRVMLSVNLEIDKTYSEIKQRIIDISMELQEYDEYSDINVLGVYDFYKSEVSSTLIDIDSQVLTTDEKNFLESLFTRFCKHYGIFGTGFIISIDLFSGAYTKTIKRIKDEILRCNPKH